MQTSHASPHGVALCRSTAQLVGWLPPCTPVAGPRCLPSSQQTPTCCQQPPRAMQDSWQAVLPLCRAAAAPVESRGRPHLSSLPSLEVVRAQGTFGSAKLHSGVNRHADSESGVSRAFGGCIAAVILHKRNEPSSTVHGTACRHFQAFWCPLGGTISGHAEQAHGS